MRISDWSSDVCSSDLGHRGAMVDALDRLFDDRSLVKIAGHEMRGRADQLDPAFVRAVIGAGALEAGQEAVMDVDAARREPRGHVRRQYLHVAREHEVIGLSCRHYRLDRGFL